ncbi:MAG: hypothetical protein IJE49_04245 [Agathobacter sp.]|nr:hypothetical protein [Agathobacter sp.]
MIGTNDKAYELYKSFCDDNQINSLYVEGADHSLEIPMQLYNSIQVLECVMRFIEGY